MSVTKNTEDLGVTGKGQARLSGLVEENSLKKKKSQPTNSTLQNCIKYLSPKCQF